MAVDSIAAEADVLYCGYDVGFFDKADIASWADQQIAAISEPSTTLLDLAMIRQTHPIDVMKLLRALGEPDAANSIEIRIGFLGVLYETGKLSLRAGIKGLWSMIHEAGLTGQQRSAIYWLDDGYELATRGEYGTLEEVVQEFCNFVAPYAQNLRDRFPHLISLGESLRDSAPKADPNDT